MPELPEVETTRQSLLPQARGQVIAKVTLHRPDLRWPITAGIEKRLKGQKIEDIRRRAKYLLFDISGENLVLAHLGMSGSFRFEPRGFNRRTHDHIVWSLENGTEIVYHDPRRFGAMLLLKPAEERSHALLSNLGPEPLSKEFNAKYLAAMLATRNAPIKPTIMDQKLVVGVGNIYASESLFRAKIHPDMPAAKVAKHADMLVKSIKSVLADAITAGGSTLRDYVQAQGESGYFQHQFDVYGREGLPCFACETAILHSVHTGRATYHCPQCQSKRAFRQKYKDLSG